MLRVLDRAPGIAETLKPLIANVARYGILTFVLIAVLAQLPTIALADIAGPARVIDGDTIEITGQRIRLHGIVATEYPPSRQPRPLALAGCSFARKVLPAIP